MPVETNLIGLKTLQKQLPGFINKLQEKIAKKTPDNIIENILRGQRGLNDKAILPQNEISTINAKRARGKGPDPLINDRQLINKRNWIVSKKGKDYTIKIKSIRDRVAYYLHKGIRSKRGLKKYEFMLKPKSHIPNWVALIINLGVTRFFAKFD